MLKGIPWQFIGPAAAAAVVILIIVFGFMLKWQKGAKTAVAPSNPPKDINATGKKTLCFQHHGDIASNQTAIKMIGDQQEKIQEQNSEQHGKLFDKIEDLGTKIITEIHKANGGQ
jgi:hypothetical protein